jgi:DUF1680 family protein
MFLATGGAAYLDVVERILYNGFLSGVSLSGDRFFYTNPLASGGDVERSEYFEVACCPANLARMMAQLPTFLYATGEDEIVVSLYAASVADLEVGDRSVVVRQETKYPWQGQVKVTVSPAERRELTLALRLPGWARERPVPSDLYRFVEEEQAVPTVVVQGVRIELADGLRQALPDGEITVREGWVRVRREWERGDTVTLDLPMVPRRVVARPEVEEARGRVALQRGPVVYAVEGVDHDGRVANLQLPVAVELSAVWRPDLLGGVTVLKGDAQRVAADGATISQPLFAVPYFSWANRGPGEMAVWLATGAPPGRI